MKREYDLVVIGAGAAGMLCAGTAAEEGLSVLLLEKNHKVGRKLLITGKGRCNVTNNCDEDSFLKAVRRNPRFLYSAINRFSTADTMAFFEGLGVPLKTERGNRVFPVSDRAADIVDALPLQIVHHPLPDRSKVHGSPPLPSSVRAAFTVAHRAVLTP